MLNLPYYNIDLKREYQYSYLLHILIRTLGLVHNCKITKNSFISACIDNNISKRSAYRYWEKGAYKNLFIKFVSKDKNFVYITGKDTFDKIIEKVPSFIYKEIKTITDLKDFLHTARLGKAGINKKIGKREVIKTGKGIRKIASETGSHLSTAIRRNKRSVKFGLDYENRYGEYKGLLVRITNIYSSCIRIVSNKYCAVNNSVRYSIKTIDNTILAPLQKALNSKITKKLGYASSEVYESINKFLYPKII